MAVSLTLSWGSMETLVPWLTASRARRSTALIVDKYWSRAVSISGSSLETLKPSFEVIDAIALDFVSNLFLNQSTIRSSSLMMSRVDSFVVGEFVMVEPEFRDEENC